MHLGRLPHADPLYDILASRVCGAVADPVFDVSSTSSSRVYRYSEIHSGIVIVAKFYKPDDPKVDRVLRIRGEYDNLLKIRAYGFDVYPNYVVRPITREESIGLALVEEYISGKDLVHYFKKAIFSNGGGGLKDKLSSLASFLAALHQRTGTGENVDLDYVSAYFRKVVEKLWRQTVLSEDEKNRCLWLMDQWFHSDLLQGIRSAIIHGDATPTNFIFTGNGDVAAIDLERMKFSDPVFDVGMVCGELKHSFFWRTGNPWGAEPFISHFLWCYALQFAWSDETFAGITRRNPFYMGLTELRIARNEYLEWGYRRRLVREAMKCLSGIRR